MKTNSSINLITTELSTHAAIGILVLILVIFAVICLFSCPYRIMISVAEMESNMGWEEYLKQESMEIYDFDNRSFNFIISIISCCSLLHKWSK